MQGSTRGAVLALTDDVDSVLELELIIPSNNRQHVAKCVDLSTANRQSVTTSNCAAEQQHALQVWQRTFRTFRQGCHFACPMSLHQKAR